MTLHVVTLCWTRRTFEFMWPSLKFDPFTPRVSSFHSERFSARMISQRWCLTLLLAMLGATSNGVAQERFKGDALVQRLPDASAYIEVQTRWTSNASTVSDSLTITVLAIKDEEIVSFAKDKVLARPALVDSTDLEHVHVRRLEVPDGPVRVEWSVNVGETPLWLHNMNVRVPLEVCLNSQMPSSSAPMPRLPKGVNQT